MRMPDRLPSSMRSDTAGCEARSTGEDRCTTSSARLHYFLSSKDEPGRLQGRPEDWMKPVRGMLTRWITIERCRPAARSGWPWACC